MKKKKKKKHFLIHQFLHLFWVLKRTVSLRRLFEHPQHNKFEPVHWISNNVVWATRKTSDQPAHKIVKLRTEHLLESLSLKGGYTCSSESTHVKMPHCWKSHATAHMFWLRNKKIFFGNRHCYLEALTYFCRQVEMMIYESTMNARL